MYILEPIAHNTIWGGKKLGRYVADAPATLGHLYMVNGHKTMSNVIQNGTCRGMTLHELFKIQKTNWNMAEYKEFPLTIALVDARENLSIQVHPDDVTAERIEHEKIGKTESWVFLEPPLNGWIYAGCKCKTAKMLEKAVANGEMEQITDRLTVTKDDYVCVTAGTLHAMTAGSLVYEIEYGSDYTYRFYDYNRKDQNGNSRELHIEKALSAIHLDTQPSVKKIADGMWMSEHKYEICRVTGVSRYRNDSSTVECISLLEGEGKCDDCDVKSGMSILLLPGETLTGLTISDAMIARLNVTSEKED